MWLWPWHVHLTIPEAVLIGILALLAGWGAGFFLPMPYMRRYLRRRHDRRHGGR